MRVFVRVDVRDRNAGRLNLSNLRCDFRRNLAGIHSPGEGASGERLQSIAESAASE